MSNLKFAETHNLVAFLEKPEESDGFERIFDFLNASSIRYALTMNPTIYTSCIKQFWATAKVKTVNGEVQIQALVDGRKVIVTKTSVRRALQLKDVEGTECLPNAIIFAELERMGYENLTQKLTFYKAFFSPQWKFLIHTILQCLSAKTTTWNEFSSTMASTVICLATNQKFNFSKNDQHKEIYVTPSHTKKVFANIKKGGKGFPGRVTPLFQTMMVQAPKELGKGLEIPTDPQHTPTIIQPSISQPQKKQPRRKQRKDIEVPQPNGSTEPITDEAANEEHVPTHSNDLLLSEIAKLKERVKKLERTNKSRTSGFKRLRKVGKTARIESSKDEEVTLVDEAQGRIDDNLMFDTGVFNEQEVEVEKAVSTTEVTTFSATTTVDELTLAQTLIEIKAAKPKAVKTAATKTTTAVIRPKARGDVFQEPSEFRTTTSSLQTSQLPQDNTQAMMEANYELAQRLQAKEQGELTIEERSKLFVKLINKRKKHFAKIRAEEIIRKPPTKAQKRNQMYSFVPIDLEVVEGSKSQAEGSKKRTREELESDNSKKKKINKNVEAEVHDEAEMKKHMEVVPDDEVVIDVIPLATKSPINVDWKIIKKGKMGYFQIIRAEGSSRRYSSMIRMLQNINREDLETLWKLVKAKHGNTRPEEAYERVLWGDLKVMFEPDVESEVWRNLQGYNVTVWKLFSSSGVHFVRFQNLHIFMLVEKKYPLTPATIIKMLNKKLQTDHWNEMCYQLLKLMTKQCKNPGSV
ncbi:hypothetical protein Tco_0769829 [Tanacetum coccineum]|uniref:Uncharacterized protein n=1 Tax=Tanacetum coccineum TaxID=301880 RepID=A0ABQ4ZAG4_9ASTR